MERDTTEDERYNKAKKKVEELKGFYGHLASFIMVNLVLIGINLATSPNHLWFYWATMGWGIGLFFHALKTFDYMPFFDKEWEQKKINEYLEKEQKNKWQ